MKLPITTLWLTLSALIPFAPLASAASGPTAEKFVFSGTGRDGNPANIEVTLQQHPSNRVNPKIQNATDDETYGSQYRRVAPADTRYNCAGDVANVLFGTGKLNFNVEDFHQKIINTFGRQVEIADKGDIVIFGNGKHITVVVGVTDKPNVVILRSKDNQESVRVGTIDLNNPADDDPIIAKNGDPTIYHIDSPVTVRRIDGSDEARAAARSSARSRLTRRPRTPHADCPAH